MFIRFFEEYYSRKSVVLRCKEALTKKLGHPKVHSCFKRRKMRVSKGFKYVKQSDTIAVNLKKDGRDVGLTVGLKVTTSERNAENIWVLIKKVHIEDQLVLILNDHRPRHWDWITEGGVTFRGMEIGDAIRFNIAAPLNERKENWLNYMVNCVVSTDFDVVHGLHDA